MRGPVVVGVDGRSSSLRTVEAAAREAERRGVGLRLAHAISWPAGHVPPGVPPWDPDGAGLRDLVNGALAEAERRAREAAPTVEITHGILVGDPVTVLESESGHAGLIVVGGRRESRVSGLRRGSVARRLAAHARCPVLVVHGRSARTGPVVLADDGTPTARRAARFALAEASARGVDLVALHTRSPWADRRHNGSAIPSSGTRDNHRLGDHDLPEGALSGLREEYPNVTVHRRLVRGRTRGALVDLCADAGLVVVGAGGRAGLASLLPGSVSQAVLRHAHGPVAVVRSGKG
ncbi:universal stress protein [Streptomyces sp. NPDC046909]|uniref:universal stress protein n=1 Tax=Streptomyces sp. NPDC046909 TaxID=3155617 RepID=UPI003403F489